MSNIIIIYSFQIKTQSLQMKNNSIYLSMSMLFSVCVCVCVGGGGGSYFSVAQLPNKVCSMIRKYMYVSAKHNKSCMQPFQWAVGSN